MSMCKSTAAIALKCFQMKRRHGRTVMNLNFQFLICKHKFSQGNSQLYLTHIHKGQWIRPVHMALMYG